MRIIELTEHYSKTKVMITIEHISVVKTWEGITAISTAGNSLIYVDEDYETVKRYILEGQLDYGKTTKR